MVVNGEEMLTLRSAAGNGAGNLLSGSHGALGGGNGTCEQGKGDNGELHLDGWVCVFKGGGRVVGGWLRIAEER